ncbi:MAG TPA: hypothetical protein VG713_12020 [Pirellulales bacterium]|nr:hypothetical protein [Pirellulales bacterium]
MLLIGPLDRTTLLASGQVGLASFKPPAHCLEFAAFVIQGGALILQCLAMLIGNPFALVQCMRSGVEVGRPSFNLLEACLALAVGLAAPATLLLGAACQIGGLTRQALLRGSQLGFAGQPRRFEPPLLLKHLLLTPIQFLAARVEFEHALVERPALLFELHFQALQFGALSGKSGFARSDLVFTLLGGLGQLARSLFKFLGACRDPKLGGADLAFMFGNLRVELILAMVDLTLAVLQVLANLPGMTLER